MDKSDLTDEQMTILKRLALREDELQEMHIFNEREYLALVILAKQEKEISKAAQLVRDYAAFGRMGHFVFMCAKWIAAIAIAITLFRTGALAFLGI